MKTYVKPDVYYENFELSQHVATCAWDMSNEKSKQSCSAVSDGSNGAIPGDSIFIDPAVCVLTDPDTYEAYCYTNGSEGFNVFNS